MASAATEADQPLYTTLSSNDGFDFHILRSAAVQSETIRRMLSPTLGFREATTNHCVFREITGVVLEKVCEYLYYKQKYAQSKDVPDMDIPPELCLELLIAADFLGC